MEPGILEANFWSWLEHLLHRHGVGGALGLLYLEESGVPIPVPGDVFVIYLAYRASDQIVLGIAFWLALIAVIVLGASNLYVFARLLGRPLVEGRVGGAFHLTPERLLRAEQWFKRWGILALVVGRHIPGARVPITVVAGILRVPYPIFALSVALSTATWAGIFFVLGHAVGDRVGGFLQDHPIVYALLPALSLAVVAYLIARFVLLGRKSAGARPPVGRQGQRPAHPDGS